MAGPVWVYTAGVENALAIHRLSHENYGWKTTNEINTIEEEYILRGKFLFNGFEGRDFQ